MSAFYGVPEDDEIPAIDLTPRKAPVTEPVDDERFVIASRMPEREFVRQPLGSRYTKRYDTPARSAFGGVDFEAMLTNAA